MFLLYLDFCSLANSLYITLLKVGVKAFTESLSLEMEMSESPVASLLSFPGPSAPIYILLHLDLRAFEEDDAGAAILVQKLN